MKKLMVVAAIALAAVGVQASSIDWSFSELVKTDGSATFADLSGAQAYLFLASDWASVASTAADGKLKVEDFTGFLDSASLNKTTAATVTTFGMAQKTVTRSTVAGEKTYNIIVVDSLADGGKVWVSEAITKSSWDETADPEPTHTVAKWSVAKANTAKYLVDGGAAYTFGSVPEPTSAMLLLLGVAGLALRRRRA